MSVPSSRGEVARMLDPFTYWTRTLASWQMIGATGQRLTDTAEASRAVIAARSQIMGRAAFTPSIADGREMARMLPEKVAAFSRASTVVADAWTRAQGDMLARTARLGSTAMLGRWPSPTEVAEFWGAIATDMLHIAEESARVGRDSLAPVHQAVTANARRLGKRGSRPGSR